jgi:tripartite-type tricarboxylate transporter receptor subunit TctC
MNSMKWKLDSLGLGLLLGFTGAQSSAAWAAQENFPHAPIRIVIGIPVGASPDVATRTIAGEMQATLGQPLVVENRPGAGGTLATSMVAAAAPDGHTLNVSGCSADAIVYGYLMSGRPALDPFKDFTPVGQLMRDHWVVLVSPETGVNSLGRLVELARRRSTPLAFPSQGEGSSPHLQSERLARQLGFKSLHVPYKESDE